MMVSSAFQQLIEARKTSESLSFRQPTRGRAICAVRLARQPESLPRAGSGSDGMIVDLRALELAAVIDVDRLPLGENVEHGKGGFAMAVAGVLHPAEGHVYFRPDGGTVHVGDPGLDFANRAHGAVDVLGVDRGRKPVGRVVL